MLNIPVPDAEDLLRRHLDFGEASWRRTRSGRFVIRGSAWLTHRAPDARRRGRKVSPGRDNGALLVLNEKHKMRLYSLDVVIDKDGVQLGVQGVRIGDLAVLLTEVLGLPSSAYKIDYFLRAERYVVLTPEDALRIAAAIGQSPQQSGGAYKNKRFLVRDLAFPVRVRTRARAQARLSIYRIENGATSAYKMEIALRGRSQDRGYFSEKDITQLDAILLALVEKNGLQPVGKPGRWEPRNRDARVDRQAYDQTLRPLPLKARRGPAMNQRLLRSLTECNILDDADLGAESDGLAASEPATGIRSPFHVSQDYQADLLKIDSTETGSTPDPVLNEEVREPDSEDSSSPPPQPKDSSTASPWISYPAAPSPTDIIWYVHPDEGNPPEPEPMPASPGLALARELHRLRGGLVEVVLPDSMDPSPIVNSILEASTRRTGIVILGLETWSGVENLAVDHPPSRGVQDLILVVDPTLMAFTTALGGFDKDDGKLKRGPAWGEREQDISRAEGNAMSGLLWDFLRDLRSECERTSRLVVLFTVDNRPPVGLGGVTRSWFFRDPRVRSFIGDAGRYWCHQRYRVDPTLNGGVHQIVALKDEFEGLVGRVLWRRGLEAGEISL